MHFTVGHIEQILDPQLLPGGNLEQHHSGGDILILRHPVGEDVLFGRLAELSHTSHLDTLLIQKTAVRRLVDGQRPVLSHPRQQLKYILVKYFSNFLKIEYLAKY